MCVVFSCLGVKFTGSNYREKLARVSLMTHFVSGESLFRGF